MFNRVQSKPKIKDDNVSSIRPAVKTPAGRERLAAISQEIEKAKTAISELEQKIERLEGIVSDADVHHKALQAAIELDNGRALSDYSAGKVDADSSIARLVLLADNSKRAATAATSALPSASAQLENAKSQLFGLEEQRVAELNRVLTMLGDIDAREYQAAFDKMCRLHDKLVGFASVAQASLGDVQLIVDPLKTPRFQFPSMQGHADSDPFLRHQVSSLTVSECSEEMV